MKQTLKKLSLLTIAFLLFGAVFSVQAVTPSFIEKDDQSKVVKTEVSQPAVENSFSAKSKTPQKETSKTPTSGYSSGQPQKRYYLQAAPNDPYYSGAWHLTAVNAPSAWNVTTGSTDVTVAVIDSGFALTHEDLSAHWKYNQGEVGSGKETDGIDNDGNGYKDDFRGWDFVPYSVLVPRGDNNPQSGSENPTGSGVSHGTEVAGLVGSVGNNGFGTTAVSQAVSLMPLRVINDNDAGYTDDVAEAIYYAVDNGADVINMSLGAAGDDPVVRAAVDYAYANNVVVVAAAGNCGNAGTGGACTGQVTGFITFPASYNRVLAVGATTSTGARASFSSYGQRLDVVAPGSGNIASPTWTSVNGTSAYKTQLFGTSYSSPIVASSVALIRSVRPTSSVDDIRALVMAGSSKLSGMSGAFYTQQLGHGILNINQSVVIATDLNNSTETEPVLLQAGGVQSEGGYQASDTIGSGCEQLSGTWCAVWFRNAQTSAERYLPYVKVGVSGVTGWNFNSSILVQGGWEARARQGEVVSTIPYSLFRK